MGAGFRIVWMLSHTLNAPEGLSNGAQHGTQLDVRSKLREDLVGKGTALQFLSRTAAVGRASVGGCCRERSQEDNVACLLDILDKGGNTHTLLHRATTCPWTDCGRTQFTRLGNAEELLSPWALFGFAGGATARDVVDKTPLKLKPRNRFKFKRAFGVKSTATFYSRGCVFTQQLTLTHIDV